jgi:hypothetical protein
VMDSIPDECAASSATSTREAACSSRRPSLNSPRPAAHLHLLGSKWF